MSAGRYVDEKGNEITVHQWIALLKGTGMGNVLAQSTVPTPQGDVDVKTLWVGMDFPEVDVKPFGTARSPAGLDQWTECEQYDTKDEALRGHTRWCWRLHEVQLVSAPPECPECRSVFLNLAWTPGTLDAALECERCPWKQIIHVEDGVSRLDVVTVLHEGVDG